MEALRNKGRSEKGFTLVEILVAVAIIAILTAIAIPVYLNQRGKAMEATVKTEVEAAVVQWQRDYYDSINVWNPSFVSGLNTAASKVTLTGRVVGSGAAAKACIEGQSTKLNKVYSYAILTKKGSKTLCASNPGM